MESSVTLEALFGTWQLVSWKRELLDTGETVEAFGKAPRGFLSYGRDGRVFFIMAKEAREKPADLARLTDHERAELYNTMVASSTVGRRQRVPAFPAALRKSHGPEARSTDPGWGSSRTASSSSDSV